MSALDGDLAGLHNAGAEGWPGSVIPGTSADVAVRSPVHRSWGLLRAGADVARRA